MSNWQRASPEAVQQTGLDHKCILSTSPNAPLFFLVHGRAGNLDIMSTFLRAVPEGCNVILPQAPLVDPIGGFSWWQVGEHAEVTERAIIGAQALENFIISSMTYYQLQPSSLAGIGFSQGGAVLSLVVQSAKVEFKALAILASFAISSPSLAKLPDLKVLALHGTQDQVVPVARLEASLDCFRSRGAEVECFYEDVGHKVGILGMRKLKEWIK